MKILSIAVLLAIPVLSYAEDALDATAEQIYKEIKDDAKTAKNKYFGKTINLECVWGKKTEVKFMGRNSTGPWGVNFKIGSDDIQKLSTGNYTVVFALTKENREFLKSFHAGDKFTVTAHLISVEPVIFKVDGGD